MHTRAIFGEFFFEKPKYLSVRKFIENSLGSIWRLQASSAGGSGAIKCGIFMIEQNVTLRVNEWKSICIPIEKSQIKCSMRKISLRTTYFYLKTAKENDNITHDIYIYG